MSNEDRIELFNYIYDERISILLDGSTRQPTTEEHRAAIRDADEACLRVLQKGHIEPPRDG